MDKKIITLGIFFMLLFMTLLVGTPTGKKTTKLPSSKGNDLELELITNTNWGNPIGVHAKVTNKGDETVYGPINVVLTIKKGFFGLFKFDEITYIILEDGKYLNPGGRADSEDWSPNPSVRFSIYTFKYKLDYEDENLNNNIDSQRYLILHYRMYYWPF